MKGIDTVWSSNPEVSFEVRGVRIDRSVPTITFVNRNLERLRGFDVFMRSLPLIQNGTQPSDRGDNEAGYGGGQVMDHLCVYECFKSWQANLIWSASTFLGACLTQCYFLQIVGCMFI